MEILIVNLYFEVLSRTLSCEDNVVERGQVQ